MLSFDSDGMPHIVGRGPSGGVAFDFDVRSGQWTGASIPYASSINGVLPLADNELGTVGTAFVTTDGKLIYSYNDHNGGWASTVLPLGLPPTPSRADMMGVGLEYDLNGFPVIAFMSGGQSYLAYDPESVVPEPATLSLLALGGLALIRRRRK